MKLLYILYYLFQYKIKCMHTYLEFQMIYLISPFSNTIVYITLNFCNTGTTITFSHDVIYYYSDVIVM